MFKKLFSKLRAGAQEQVAVERAAWVEAFPSQEETPPPTCYRCGCTNITDEGSHLRCRDCNGYVRHDTAMPVAATHFQWGSPRIVRVGFGMNGTPEIREYNLAGEVVASRAATRKEMHSGLRA